tara:strand:- start:867 stop:1652 length:786 start_codon:yes stop_codon:yes gene_type:complete
MKSAYYCIIPKTILHHPKLKANAKLVYAEIMATLEDDGVCIKRNIHFANVLNISKDTASRAISELKNFGIIHVLLELEKGTEKFLKRYITPMQNFLWVNQDPNTPYMQNTIGVDNSLAGNDALTHMQNTQTLLYNNNNTDKLYTNGKKPNTTINKSINDKQLKYIKEIVNSFYKKQSEKFPHLYNNWQDDNDLINKSVNEIYDLIKIDSVDYKLIKQVIDWATIDRFWHKSLVSLKTLRRKSENGFTKWNNILTNYRSNLQ